jgi:hypothetical protein
MPGLDGLGGAAGGHNRGGGPPVGCGSVPAGSHSGTPAGGRGGSLVGGSSPGPAPGKGKQARVVLDDDEVSSNEDEHVQKQLRQHSDAGPAVPDEAVAAKRVAGAVRDSPARCPQWPGLRGRRLHPASQTSLQGCLETSICLASSLFFGASFPDYISFLPSSSPSSAATATGMTASAIGTAAADEAVGVTPGLAPDGEPRTPKRVPEDVVEDSEEESEVASELVPEVVRDEAPAEGAMVVVLTAAAPPPSRGAHAPLLSAPRTAVASGAATGEGMEVVLGHPCNTPDLAVVTPGRPLVS